MIRILVDSINDKVWRLPCNVKCRRFIVAGSNLHITVKGSEALMGAIQEIDEHDLDVCWRNLLEMFEDCNETSIVDIHDVVFKVAEYQGLFERFQLSKKQLQFVDGLNAVKGKIKETAPFLSDEIHHDIYFLLTQTLLMKTVTSDVELLLPHLVEIYDVYHGIGNEDFRSTGLSWKIRQAAFPRENMGFEMRHSSAPTRQYLLEQLIAGLKQMTKRQRDRQQNANGDEERGHV